LRQEEDHQPTSRIHRDYMPVVMEKHGAIPSRANMGDLLQDTGTCRDRRLEQTITWLHKGAEKWRYAAFTSIRNACTAWKPSNRPA
jgi:hypothetical protein